MRISKDRYSCSLDQYNVSEGEKGEAILQIKQDHEFILESVIDVGIMYSKISGKNVLVLSKKYVPLEIEPNTTADDLIEQFYTTNKKVFCQETISHMQNKVQTYLKTQRG